LSLSAAREKVRTAQALREMPRICAAFADGRLSYSKVRALTRVVQTHDEDLLLAYALQGNAAHVEERCRQIRNATPESVGGAWRAWERRSLTLWRNDARNTMTISVEVPIEAGELIAQALERAVQAGEARWDRSSRRTRERRRMRERTTHAAATAAGTTRAATVGALSRRTRSSRSRRRISPVADAATARPPLHRLPITAKSSCTWMIQPSAEGRGDRICRSTPSSA